MAMAVAVAVLMLYAFGSWPKALPYGEPMPYIAVRNTTKGVQLGAFDYSGLQPRVAHFYVNGRYAGSGAGWADVYARCGDYVEALFQYDGLSRRVAGRVECGRPLRTMAGGGVAVFGSRTPLEAEATISSLGIRITTACVERVSRTSPTRYIYTYYPVFYVEAKSAMFMEYQTGLARYTAAGAGSKIKIDPGGANAVYGTFRSYVHPPYGYSISDYQGTRDVAMNFIVSVTDYREVDLGGFVAAYVSTKGYVEMDGVRYELATCEYSVSATVWRVTVASDLYEVNSLEPDAVYEVLIISPNGSVYRQTFAFYPNDQALRITTSKVQQTPPGVTGFCVNVNISGTNYKMCGYGLSETLVAYTRYIRAAKKVGINEDQVYDEIRKSMAMGEGYDKIFGNPWDIKYVGKIYHTETDVDLHVSKRVRPGGLSEDFAWVALPGIFRGLTVGGWDLFLGRAPNKFVLNSPAPPVIVTFG